MQMMGAVWLFVELCRSLVYHATDWRDSRLVPYHTRPAALSADLVVHQVFVVQ
jgi:hypothetical protein